MQREFWQTIHGSELTCYGSSEGSRLRSPVNVGIMQHIIHAEGVLEIKLSNKLSCCASS